MRLQCSDVFQVGALDARFIVVVVVAIVVTAAVPVVVFIVVVVVVVVVSPLLIVAEGVPIDETSLWHCCASFRASAVLSMC